MSRLILPWALGLLLVAGVGEQTSLQQPIGA